MRYEPIDQGTINDIIDGATNNKKSVEDIVADLGSWGNFLATVLDAFMSFVQTVKDILQQYNFKK